MIDTEEIRRALEHDAPAPAENTTDAWERVPGRARHLHRRRIGLRVAAVTTVVALALGTFAILQSSSDDTSRSIVATPSPDAPPTVDVVPLYLWVDAGDVRATGDLYERLADQLATCGAGLVEPECSIGLFDFPDGLYQYEDANTYQSMSPDGGAADVRTNRGTDRGKSPVCSDELRAAAAPVAAASTPLVSSWQSEIRRLETVPPVSTAITQDNSCLESKGYSVGLPTVVSDGWAQLHPGADRRKMNRDMADCIEPVVAARASVRPAARQQFVAEHADEVARLQSAFDELLRVIYGQAPMAPTVPSTTTIAPQTVDPSQISGVNALAADASGGVYLADANRHQVTYRSSTGDLRTVAGTGEGGSSGDGGPATEAQLERPTSLALAADGTLYVADQGTGQVRAVDRNGVISTAVTDVKGAASVAVGPTGELYVVGNDGVFVVEDSSSRLLIAGGPGRITVNGQTEAFFPSAIVVATNGDLWVAGLSPKQLVRFDADGNLLEARDDVYVSFNSGLAAHPDGRVIVADYGRFAVDAFTPGRFAEAPPEAASIAKFLDAEIPGVTGHLRPTAVAVAPDGAIYVNDDGRGSGTTGVLARVESDGTVTPLTR